MKSNNDTTTWTDSLVYPPFLSGAITIYMVIFFLTVKPLHISLFHTTLQTNTLFPQSKDSHLSNSQIFIMSTPGPLFIIGTGPMIGSHIPRLFATHNFTHIALFARSQTTLTASSEFITTAAPSVSIHTYTADVMDTLGLTSALQKAEKEVGSPEVVVYNAARVSYGNFGEYKEEDILEDFKIPNLGLYTTAKVLLPGLQALAKEKPDSHPSLFVTSSPIIYQPFAPVFSLSMAKAAQANLVKSLIEQTKDEVHVALVMVGGPVSEQEPVNNPNHIATKFWELWEQKKGDRVVELLVQ
ncbi:hypothetical protein OCU04_002141 [Sclerotinia nivalis]|uniref:Uncharacterized protein n=1 Tax=Sclerotinia nivalis TaxID=352851 RepID=A0A9X0B063_9HELO|nr:hypothetical protein OCU04_002141 [Sclerotinia nivalis]